jgi:hypothetical protein
MRALPRSDLERSLARVVCQPVLEKPERIQVQDGDKRGRVMSRAKGIVDYEVLDSPCLFSVNLKPAITFLIAPADCGTLWISHREACKVVG